MSEIKPSQPTLAHRVEYAGFRAIEAVISLLPVDTCAAVGRLLGGTFQLLSRKYRRLIRRNLRIVTAAEPLPPEQFDRLVSETFRRAGANFLTSLRCVGLSPEEVGKFIETEGAELASRTPERGGFVAAIPHMGNWEALTKIAILHAGSSRYGSIYRPLDNPLMDELTYSRRSEDGAVMFSRNDGFHAPISLLRSPGSMVVLADQRAGGRGIVIPFFGKLASCSPLPQLMARRAKAEVGTLSISTVANGRWSILFRSIGYSPSVAEIMAGLEVAMRRSLPDVFWFHNRWRIDAGRPLSFFAKLDPEVARSATVPLRLLLTTPADSDAGARALIAAMLEERPDLHIDWLTNDPADYPDSRVVLHQWDPEAPPEHADGLLSRIDAAHPAPLDGALLFGSEIALARASRRAGLRAILGLDVNKKPWTRSFKKPNDMQGWCQLATDMARVPQANKR